MNHSGHTQPLWRSPRLLLSILRVAMVLNRRRSPHHSARVCFFLVFTVGVHALDEHAVTAMPLKLQENIKLQLNELWKSRLPPEPPAKPELLNSKGALQHELQGSNLLTLAMQEQIRAAKKLASLARLHRHPRLLRELRFQIKENEQALGASAVDRELPKSAPEKMRALRQVLARATERHHNCEDMMKRLRSSVMVNEDKVLALMEENKNLGRLAARTMPKGFHCLALQLTIQYYNDLGQGSVVQDQRMLDDDGLLHSVIYTENILAATAIINSTIYSAKEPHRHVFHVLTDGLNYPAMQMWFQSNAPNNAVVEVKNLEILNVTQGSLGLYEKSRKYLKLPMLKVHFKQEDIEMMKRLRLYYDLPVIFPRLEKVLVLDDDIVVQKDLSHLWKEDLHEQVIGAVGSCETSSMLGGTLSWACMNIVDLGEWRRQGLSDVLTLETDMRDIWDGMSLLRESNTHLLDESVCRVIDLNDHPSKFVNGTRDAAVIHYGGFAKPWLGIGMNRHRSMWTRFVNYDHPLLQACNIHR